MMYVDIKWVKLAVNWYKDDEIRLIRKLPAGNEIALMFVMLLGMAGELNKGGYIPYTPEDLSNLLDIKPSTVELGIKAMLHKGLLEEIDGVYHITNWDKWQAVDSFEKLKIQRRDATRRWREKKALETNIPALPDPTDQAPETKQTAAERRFERFWKAYPKKVGKGGAEKSFAKYKPDDQLTETMIRAIEAQKMSRQWKEGYIPNPQTWLNQKRWLDEMDEEALPFTDPPEPAYIRDESIEDWN